MFDGKLGEDKWLSNLLIARQRWVSVPVERVWPGLCGWHCQTCACFIGHCVTWDVFIAQGVSLDDNDVPCITGAKRWHTTGFDVSRELFGNSELAGPAEDCTSNTEAHAEVLRRLDTAIAERRAVLAKVVA